MSHQPPVGIERRVLITQWPVGTPDSAPLDLMAEHGVEFHFNPKKRILNEAEMMEIVGDYGIIFSGTSPLSRKVIEKAPHLRFISRAGIGLDSVDLLAARERNILVSYTPDAPAPAVSEFTMAMMLSLSRHVTAVDRNMRKGVWKRTAGKRLETCTIGVIGVGRTGKRVIQHLAGFKPARILANDLAPDEAFGKAHGIEWVDKETIYREADIITLHIPLTHLTRHLLAADQFGQMKETALLINTSRGGIVSDAALADALRANRIAGAAVDVFEKEPYEGGPLAELDNCILTAHMAAASPDCSRAMELGAASEIIRFLNGEPLQGLVPDYEYRLREQANG